MSWARQPPATRRGAASGTHQVCVVCKLPCGSLALQLPPPRTSRHDSCADGPGQGMATALSSQQRPHLALLWLWRHTACQGQPLLTTSHPAHLCRHLPRQPCRRPRLVRPRLRCHRAPHRTLHQALLPRRLAKRPCRRPRLALERLWRHRAPQGQWLLGTRQRAPIPRHQRTLPCRRPRLACCACDDAGRVRRHRSRGTRVSSTWPASANAAHCAGRSAGRGADRAG